MTKQEKLLYEIHLKAMLLWNNDREVAEKEAVAQFYARRTEAQNDRTLYTLGNSNLRRVGVGNTPRR